MITLFDITIFAIITIFSFVGLYQGIIGFIIRAIGFIASIALTYFLYPYALEIVHKYTTNEIIEIIFAGIASYIVSLIICIFITYKFLAVISFMRGGFVDKLLGLFSGFTIGLLTSTVLFLITAMFTSNSYLKSETFEKFIQNADSDKYSGVLKRSLTTNYLDEISKNVIMIIPANSLESIKILNNKNSDKLKKKSKNDLQDEKDKISVHIKDDE
ncbi:CvpA family protein [Rickettsia endosymbiont of Halotydeus destructor]|uniref:CvpA family protein n=1 Tax=Rickettsia endosymbiont of Halotydeus destructor TaxID=2996754 RepID=UPI003BB18DA2